jgi:hydrogenase/urease accessory protein HupE
VLSVIRELWAFMRERKKLWLAPIIVVLVVISGLLLIAQGTALAPFIYSIF